LHGLLLPCGAVSRLSRRFVHARLAVVNTLATATHGVHLSPTTVCLCAVSPVFHFTCDVTVGSAHMA
jgi:hypothetical protein